MTTPTPLFLNKLAGKKVLIIGGSTGVGYSVAQGVLEFGGTAILSSSSSTRITSSITSLQTAVPSASSRIYGHALDLSTATDLDARMLALLTAAQQDHDGAPIDHIVFTAGNSVPIGPVSEASQETIIALLQVRVTGAIYLAKHAPAFMAPGPFASITLTTGDSKDKPPAGWALVAGLIGTSQEGLVRGLAVELAPRRVNLVTIGMTDTEILTKIGVVGEIREQGIRGTLTKRLAQPEEVAEAYLYLMRDPGITGTVINSNGGRLLA